MLRTLGSSLLAALVSAASAAALAADAGPPQGDAGTAADGGSGGDAGKGGDAGTAGSADAAADAATPACITYWGEARTRYPGYDHVVHIKSSCTKTADCVVSTNVAPEPLKTVVPAGAKVEVFTFLQSPASAFTPNVTCKLRP